MAHPLDITARRNRIDLLHLIEAMPPCGCGGKLDIRDHGPPDPDDPAVMEDNPPDPDFRFEVSCDGCDGADPNGYATPEEAAERGAQYFA